MLSFKDYIVEQDYIDWDYVFGFILEEEDEPDFKVKKHERGQEIHTHTFTVPKKTGKGNHKVEVSISKYGQKHNVDFIVDDNISALTAKKIPGKQRMKILRGVSKAITSYAKKNVKPGHSIYGETFDMDDTAQEKKYKTQGMFFDKLARHLGGNYNDLGGKHEVKIPIK